MPPRLITAEGVRKLLERECAEAGGQKAWAEINRLSPTYVSTVLSGRADPGKSMLEALGLERVTSYRRKEEI